MDAPLSEAQIRDILETYFDVLQSHLTAEETMAAILTEDFETGFATGFRWQGLDGLREFLVARAGFVEDAHEVRELLSIDPISADQLTVRTRLEFLLRDPAGAEYTGSAFHTWLLRRSGTPPWRVAAQVVDGFAELNENAARLFSTPDEGLSR